MSDPPACKVGVGLETSPIVTCALSVQMVAQMSVSFHRSFNFLKAHIESKPLKCWGFNSCFLLPRPPCPIDFHQIKSFPEQPYLLLVAGNKADLHSLKICEKCVFHSPLHLLGDHHLHHHRHHCRLTQSGCFFFYTLNVVEMMSQWSLEITVNLSQTALVGNVHPSRFSCMFRCLPGTGVFRVKRHSGVGFQSKALHFWLGALYWGDQ